MDTITIKENISKLEKENLEYNKQIKKYKEKIELCNASIKKLTKIENDFEKKMREILNTIVRKASLLSEKNKFKSQYPERIKKIIFGTDYSHMLTEINTQKKDVKKQISVCEEKINYYNNHIKTNKQKINELKQQLSKEV